MIEGLVVEKPGLDLREQVAIEADLERQMAEQMRVRGLARVARASAAWVVSGPPVVRGELVQPESESSVQQGQSAMRAVRVLRPVQLFAGWVPARQSLLSGRIPQKYIGS